SVPVSMVKAVYREKFVLVPFLILTPILVFAVFAEFIAPYNPLKTRVGPALTPPSPEYIMGTDQAGGDIFSQVVFGARTAMYVALASTALSVIIGFAVGIPAGYLRGLVDEILMRIADIVLSIPSFVLIIFLIVLFGGNINIIVAIIALVSWPTLARITRAQILSVREREFVLAAKALGASPIRVMFSEILPNIILPIIPAITLQMGFAILIESGVSFLGLGDQNVMSWGRILWMASRSIYAGVWWGILFPGLALSISILSLNLLGDGVSRIINPRQIRKV
ncbi:MAG: ABC transporter permease, partial [Candidatus Caldarchaeum sp.]|nr:ABC transporter permease [Candidatus Caldarchaeum sp.]